MKKDCKPPCHLSICTLSKDTFKSEFIRAFIDVCPSVTQKKYRRIWNFHIVQALFSRVRKNALLSMNIRKGIVICPSNGFLLMHESLPYNFNYEVVPFLWDCWPASWSKLIEALNVLHVRLCFVTSKQVCEMLSERCPHLRTVYVPEAVNSDKFFKGKDLKEREIDVFEVGRKYERYHYIISNFFSKLNGKESGNFVDGYIEDYYQTLSNTKITISFPRCDTNSEMAGEIETLTERYWEAMFSRCLIIGRAPRELINLIGYNPVVEVDWTNAHAQLRYTLHHIADFQGLVDKNYLTALKFGDWRVRMPQILSEINGLIEHKR